MKCVICKHGETQQGHATITLERGEMVLVVTGVPAQVCSECGEDYVSEETTVQILNTAENLSKNGTKLEVREYLHVEVRA
jgi:YgiT-type zinc finger domain-containing protein